MEINLNSRTPRQARKAPLGWKKDAPCEADSKWMKVHRKRKRKKWLLMLERLVVSVIVAG